MDKMFYKGIEIHPYDTFYYRDSPRFFKVMRGDFKDHHGSRLFSSSN
jgi:hypothetical protein